MKIFIAILVLTLDICYLALVYGKEHDPIEKYGSWIDKQSGFKKKFHKAILYIIAAVIYLPLLLLMSIGGGDYE